MSVKIGETPVLRGTPPVLRTLEVLVDADWLRSDHLEKCVSFREANHKSGKTVIVFSRSISSEEARHFAALLLAAAEVIDNSTDVTDSSDGK